MALTQSDNGEIVATLKPNQGNVRVSRQSQDTLHLATFLGMMVLFIAVMFVVIAKAPNFPSDPAFIASWNERNRPGLYFTQAKVLVRPLVMTFIEKMAGQSGVSLSLDDAVGHRTSWTIEDGWIIPLTATPNAMKWVMAFGMPPEWSILDRVKAWRVASSGALILWPKRGRCYTPKWATSIVEILFRR